jgi:hypothetical protein
LALGYPVAKLALVQLLPSPSTKNIPSQIQLVVVREMTGLSSYYYPNDADVQPQQIPAGNRPYGAIEVLKCHFLNDRRFKIKVATAFRSSVLSLAYRL